jgi:selenocysteine lyase/cysteine desulfurase
MNKRTFLKQMTLAGLAAPLSNFSLAASSPVSSSPAAPSLAAWIARFGQSPNTLQSAENLPSPNALQSAENLVQNEDFWTGIRNGYHLKPDYINLENGYYCVQPDAILEAFTRHVREVNLQGAYYMRTVQFEKKKAMAARLASLAGCNPADLIITRNTTESLDLIIGGYPWKQGDEAIMAQQDYGAMLQMFGQAERRHGIVRKILSVPNHPKSDEEIVSLYEKAITPKTRLLMVSHMINITGQILPVRKICDMAHARGVEVMVDGAHSFAHIVHSIPDLDCDYYGASLHKWLSVPLGAGILYVKPGLADKIAEHAERMGHAEKMGRAELIWPLLAEPDDSVTGLARLNHTGTHPVHTDLAIGDALDYYNTLGAERKEARLRYLQQYWTSKVRDLSGVVVNTPADPARACGIANVGIKGMKPADLADRLLRQYKIYTVAIDSPAADVQGCRITPNLFTMPEELDTLVSALKAQTSA